MENRIYFIPTQPRREQELGFRTHITRPTSRYDVFHLNSIIAQVVLYRAFKENFIPNGVGIGDLYKALFRRDFPKVTKHRMGHVIVNATCYNPRVLKGVTKKNDKNIMMYVWNDMRDPMYGIEWQICSWLWKLEDQPSEDQMSNYLREIGGGLSLTEVMDLYIKPASEIKHKIDWNKVWRKFKMVDQEELWIQKEAPPIEERERYKLKSLL